MSITAKRDGSVRKRLTAFTHPAESRRRIQCRCTIDELISQMGFARSICSDMEVRERIKALQLDLYRIGATIARPPEAENLAEAMPPSMMDALEAEVHRIESVPGVLGDGSMFWELPAAAALDVARTVCRHAERVVGELFHKGELSNTFIPVYLNRLPDLLWLLGRLLESRRGIDS